MKTDAYIEDTNTNLSSMQGDFFKVFAEVIKKLWPEESFVSVINTVALKNQIQRCVPRFLGYVQQDSQ